MDTLDHRNGSSQPQDLELVDLTRDAETSTNRQDDHAVSSLPPVDGGRSAWLIVAASFAIETVIWGFPYPFGIVASYYRTHGPISEAPAGLSAVGTTCSGIMYLAAPLMTAMMQQGPILRRYSAFIGLILLVLGLGLSSLATKVWHLILTQGIIYAIGGGMIYYPALLFIDEWFIRRKQLAYGVMWAGTGVGGLTGPLVLEWGLTKYGAPAFLRGWAIAMLLSIGPLLFFVKPRVPWSGSSLSRRRRYLAGYGFLKMSNFWILNGCVAMQGLGYFIPTLYLPDYARMLGLSQVQSSAIVSILNVSFVPGVIALSLFCDYMSVLSVVAISSGGSALAIFLFWGLSSPSASLPLLATFAIVYGFFAGGFTGTFSAIALDVQRRAPEGAADIGSLFGLISMARGIGNVVCGPISEALLQDQSHAIGVGLKSHYSPLVIFSGISAVLTMTPWAARQLRIL